jgi:phosphatidylserine/phosphatidylglycerophosphate/cardiolipin synthase-like enzyme
VIARPGLLVIAFAGCGSLGQSSHLPRRTQAQADAALAPVDDQPAFANLDQRLDRSTGSFARTDNRVELLVDGRTSFARRLDNARSADVILIKTFAFTDDETGRAVADVLVERARAGAHVVVQ